jgi:hypothetical protein
MSRMKSKLPLLLSYGTVPGGQRSAPLSTRPFLEPRAPTTKAPFAMPNVTLPRNASRTARITGLGARGHGREEGENGTVRRGC